MDTSDVVMFDASQLMLSKIEFLERYRNRIGMAIGFDGLGAIVCYLNGMNEALGGSCFIGWREWLEVETSVRGSVSWAGIIVHVVLGEEEFSSRHRVLESLSASEQARFVEELRRLYARYYMEREKGGLQEICRRIWAPKGDAPG